MDKKAYVTPETCEVTVVETLLQSGFDVHWSTENEGDIEAKGYSFEDSDGEESDEKYWEDLWGD